MRRKKSVFFALAFILAFGLGLNKDVRLKSEELLLILNAPAINPETKQILEDQSLPRNWRSTLDPYRKNDLGFEPSRAGLDDLKASGSAEFSTKQFLKIRETLKGKRILVIDLRQEAHGFLDGYAVSWYGIDDAMNANKTLKQIER